ncbi:polysaccharide lyase family 4 protein [Sphaerobolus stellatus SS14]|nr:polysaccharide lyase family 4 protein [Sphaerobolus stellatus SS14]
MLWSIITGFYLLATTVAGFGLTESGNSYIVDTSGGLIFTDSTIDKTSGDITSMKFNGIEITCATSTLTQYYVARYTDPAIHMATYITSEPSIDELRFIALTASEIVGGSAIEGSDVFSANGQTRSKFYSSKQFIDDQVHGVTGSGVGVYMIIPGIGYESSSGGSFMRDINNQGGDPQELYYYMNSGHTQTEAFRVGLYGLYALWFTTGSVPSGSIDTTFWEGLSVNGLVPKASRGRFTGKASAIGFSNSATQYWVRTDTSGSFTSPYMKPGTYTMTLYKVELAVASQSVSVTAGGVTNSNIVSREAVSHFIPSIIWQIGDYDGTPRGFLNADPSDSRMKSWGPTTFTVGNAINTFPMAAFKAIGPVTIRFTLSSSQGGARTLQIATTLAFAGGRPQVTVNGWSGPTPAAPSQPDSRGITRGTWCGNVTSGILYTNSTVNVITINVISGSSGNNFLSPKFVFDTVRLY